MTTDIEKKADGYELPMTEDGASPCLVAAGEVFEGKKHSTQRVGSSLYVS